MPPAPIAALGEPDAGPSSSSLELPSTDPGKLQALPVGPGVHCGDPASGSPDSQVSVGDSPQDMGSIGEPSSSTKIPNRDSGIDSPSCSVVSEHFPCEEGSEAAPGPTIKGLHPETAPEGTTPREEADSDVGEGSSEEPEAENSRPRADADPAKVGHLPVPGIRGFRTVLRGHLGFTVASRRAGASSGVHARVPCSERAL